MLRLPRFVWVLPIVLTASACGTAGVRVLPDHNAKYADMDRIRSDITAKNETVADLYPDIQKKAKKTDDKPAPTPAPAPKPRGPGAIVAVFDIEDASKRFKRDTLDQLHDYLTTKLTEYAGYRVIPREQLRARLVEEKTSSYKKCHDQQCQIELGKTLAAQKSLSTRVLGVGNKCAVTAKLFDLRTETTERAASVDTKCAQERLMEAMEQIARKLAGQS